MVEKCSQIETLYLRGCSIGIEIISPILECCHRLKCLGFYDVCYVVQNIWPQLEKHISKKVWPQIAEHMSKKLIDWKFSANNVLYVRRNNENIGFHPIERLIKDLTTLTELHLSKELQNYSLFFQNLPKSIRILRFNQIPIDLNFIDALINGNGKEIIGLFLNEYSMEEGVFI
jgi:hypothetical protein